MSHASKAPLHVPASRHAANRWQLWSQIDCLTLHGHTQGSQPASTRWLQHQVSRAGPTGFHELHINMVSRTRGVNRLRQMAAAHRSGELGLQADLAPHQAVTQQNCQGCPPALQAQHISALTEACSHCGSALMTCTAGLAPQGSDRGMQPHWLSTDALHCRKVSATLFLNKQTSTP